VMGIVTSASIETGQFLFIGSRFATLDDILMNSIGAAIGVTAAVLARASKRAHRHRRPESRTGGSA
jgi:glycopeptide antibiotics resistance protein